MARVTNGDPNDERGLDSERDMVRGIAEEGDLEEAEDLDEEDIDDEEETTF
jgi:hypothetical protein